VVNIFAREITDDLASLVKQIDDTVGKNEEKKMAAFVVLLSEDADAAAAPLEKLAEEHKISHTPLTVFDGVAGPPEYSIAEDADVTVMMWVGGKVKINHALRKDELKPDKIKEIVEGTSQILE
jgi:hypothetical protein